MRTAVGAMRTRGASLIEAMIAVAIVSIGVGLLVGPWSHYERASRRALAVEGLAHVLDLELERARSCPTRACIQALVTATTAADGATTWARAEVVRSVREGPHGTLEVEISAEVPAVVPRRKVATRIWRP